MEMTSGFIQRNTILQRRILFNCERHSGCWRIL